MDAILNFLSRATGRNLDDETVQTTVIACGIGLLLLLLFQFVPWIYLTESPPGIWKNPGAVSLPIRRSYGRRQPAGAGSQSH